MNYEINGKAYDLSPAKEYISKGKWNLAVAFISKETGVSAEEAKNIATEVKETWLAERQAQMANQPETQKKGKAGIVIVILFLIAVLGGGGYFAYNHFIAEPAQYAVEDEGEVETEAVGAVSTSTFDVMENAEGHYFVLYNNENVLYRVSKDSFNDEISNVNEVTQFHSAKAEQTTTNAAKSVKKMLDSNFYDYEYSMTPSGYGMPEDITVDGITYKNQVYEAENGNHIDTDMYEYFKSRDLDISCKNVSVEKIAVGLPDKGTAESDDGSWFYVILNAEVTTNHCNGDSIFPPEGETKNMTIEVGGSCLAGDAFGISNLIFR